MPKLCLFYWIWTELGGESAQHGVDIACLRFWELRDEGSDANAITTGEASGYDLNRPVCEGNGMMFFMVHNTTCTTG
jgi:hypothetical protein